MKLSRIPAIGAATALIAGSVLIATPANAVTVVADGNFYVASDFGVETAGYPAGVDWFYGDVTGLEGSHTFGATGLDINTTAPGSVQILNQTGATPADATDLAFAVDLSAVIASNGAWNFQLAFFAEAGSAGFTTLRPQNIGTIDSTALWIPSQTIAATGSTPAYPGGVAAQFSDLADALYAGTDPTLLAYGAFFDPTDVTTVYGVVYDNDDFSFFGPVPTRTISPSPVSVAQSTSTGISFTGSHWIPGSTVYISIANGPSTLYFDDTTYTADANGNVAVTVVLPTAPEVGTYNVYFDDDLFYYGADVFPDVDLDIAATATAALPPTGIDSASTLVLGSVVLGLGVVLAVFAIRRRARA